MSSVTEDALVARRSAKDTVFTDLFRDPEYVLQLYRCLHPEDETATVDQITEITRKGILTNSMYNDLGFLVRDTLIILVEAQSTWSVNIILRVLFYLVQAYHDFLNQREQSLYSAKKVTIPKPELYVLYTGRRRERQEFLTFSQEFFSGEDCALEVRVKVIYEGKEGDIVQQYIAFAHIFDEQVKKYGRTRQAVMETLRICQDGNVLRNYLRSRETEVVSIMMSLFDDETILRGFFASERREARAAGREEGREAGREETLVTALRNMLHTGMSLDQAMSLLVISEEERPHYAALLEQ